MLSFYLFLTFSGSHLWELMPFIHSSIFFFHDHSKRGLQRKQEKVQWKSKEPMCHLFFFFSLFSRGERYEQISSDTASQHLSEEIWQTLLSSLASHSNTDGHALNTFTCWKNKRYFSANRLLWVHCKRPHHYFDLISLVSLWKIQACVQPTNLDFYIYTQWVKKKSRGKR